MPANPPSPSLRRTLPWLVLLAVVLRLGLMAWSLHTHPSLASPPLPSRNADLPRPSTFGFEASSVAAALVCEGRGFSDPFGIATGPTAWVSPGVVALYAVPFALFGCYTPASVVGVLLAGVALSAATVLLLAGAALRLLGGRRAALAAGLLAALSPWDLALFTAASTLDLNLHGFLLLLLLYLLLGVWREGASRRRLATFGLAAAAATLCNPVLTVVAAGGLGVILWRQWRRLAGALAALLAALILLAGPYLLYQRARLGAWVWVKSNLPFELSLGNGADVAGVAAPDTFRRHHPSQNPAELERYRRLGEVGYVDLHARRLHHLSAGDVARWTVRRAGSYFFGLPPAGPPRQGCHRLGVIALSLMVGTPFLVYPAARRFHLRRGDLLVPTLALLYAAPHLAAVVQQRYVLPITPLSLLLVAGVIHRFWAARCSDGVDSAGAVPRRPL